MTPRVIESTTLHYCEGGSDKVYSPSITVTCGSFDVTASYGRRGATMQVARKATGVSEAVARKTYAKLVSDKVAKGYRPTDGDSPVAAAVVSERDGNATGLPVQLLTEASESETHELLQRATTGLQQKMDGERRLLVKRAGDVYGVNRRGLRVALPTAIVTAAEALPEGTVLDGEIIGNRLHVFDTLEIDGKDVTQTRFGSRYDKVAALIDFAEAHTPPRAIVLVPLVVDPAWKVAVFREFQRSGVEGIVLRDLSARYTAGRPNSGGPVRKYKFYATASVIVLAHNSAHSVAMGLHDERGTLHDVGSVTIAPSKPLPPVGSIGEVRYLYFQRSLYQPTWLSGRTDIDASDCTTAQLKFKGVAA